MGRILHIIHMHKWLKLTDVYFCIVIFPIVVGFCNCWVSVIVNVNKEETDKEARVSPIMYKVHITLQLNSYCYKARQ